MLGPGPGSDRVATRRRRRQGTGADRLLARAQREDATSPVALRGGGRVGGSRVHSEREPASAAPVTRRRDRQPPTRPPTTNAPANHQRARQPPTRRKLLTESIQPPQDLHRLPPQSPIERPPIGV